MFDSVDEVIESNAKSADWVRNNVLEFTKGMPEVMIGNTLIAEVKEQSSFTTIVLEGNKHLPQRPPILFSGGNVMRRRHDDPIGNSAGGATCSRRVASL